MSSQQIAVDSSPNQTWQVSVNVNGGVLTLFVVLRYNEVAGYWVMTVFDSNQNLLLDSWPLVTGLNLLAPLNYLQIGSVFILNVGSDTNDYPNNTDLGTDFIMVWSDNVKSISPLTGAPVPPSPIARPWVGSGTDS